MLTGWRTAVVMAVTAPLWRIGDNHFHLLSSALRLPYLQDFEYRTDLIPTMHALPAILLGAVVSCPAPEPA